MRIARLVVCVLLCLVPSSCDIEDENELCCDKHKVVFRYTLGGVDCFSSYITSMKYFLFDEEGMFLFELESENGDISTVCLCNGIPSGTYSLVAVGNLIDYGTIDAEIDGGLAEFVLQVDDWLDDGTDAFANGDKVYWGQVDFTLDQSNAETFVCQMANIHCQMLIRVEWESLPTYTDGYRYCLDDIGTISELNSYNAYSLGVQSFPLIPDYNGKMMEDVTLRQFALQATLYTLRITNEDMPIFRLYHDDEILTPDIDISVAFTEWGIRPSLSQVQDYELLLTINDDGTVVLSRNLDSYISDWEDGGYIGN